MKQYFCTRCGDIIVEICIYDNLCPCCGRELSTSKPRKPRNKRAERRRLKALQKETGL